MVLHRVTTALGVAVSLGRVVAAQLLGHAGKYVPGKAIVVVLRVGALRPTGDVPDGFTTRATIAVFFETLLMMAVGGTFAGVLLWSAPVPLWVKGSAAAMAVAAALPTFPPLMRWVIQQITRRTGGSDENNALHLSRIDWPLFASGWFWSLLSWIGIGLSFACLIVAIPSLGDGSATGPISIDASRLTWPLLFSASAAIALGMVLGFASLIPGGAGVRETVTLLALAPAIGQTHALLAVIGARLLFVVVESLLALASYVALKRTTRKRT